MLRFIRDLILVSIVSVFVFMLLVKNVIAIFFGIVRTIFETAMSPITFYNYGVGEAIAFATSASMAIGALATVAIGWRYGRSDGGPTIRGDIQALRMKWDLRGIDRD